MSIRKYKNVYYASSVYQFSFFPQVVQLRWRGGTGKSDFAIEPQIGHSICLSARTCPWTPNSRNLNTAEKEQVTQLHLFLKTQTKELPSSPYSAGHLLLDTWRRLTRYVFLFR